MRPVPADIDWDHWIREAALAEAPKVKAVEQFSEEIAAEFRGIDLVGDKLPWTVMDDKIRLRAGEVSIWAGINGHGKSQILGQTMLWVLRDSPVLIASLEMPIPKTCKRLIRQAAGADNPAEVFQRRFAEYTFGMLWFYDEMDTVETARLYGLVCYAATELGCKHIVIDSLMKCGVNDDDFNGQKRFVDRLCQMAKRYRVHIHLVAHMRKGEKEAAIPDKFDVMGSSNLTNLVDNLFIVHRNKAKEAKVRAGEEPDREDPDQRLIVAKQRHGEWEGMLRLWYNAPSMQYVRNVSLGPLPWPTPEDRWLAKWSASRKTND